MPRDQLTGGTVEPIREMAAKNRLWGAERVRGESPKIGIRVSKRTIRKHLARLAREHVAFFDLARPHQGIAQRSRRSSRTFHDVLPGA